MLGNGKTCSRGRKFNNSDSNGNNNPKIAKALSWWPVDKWLPSNQQHHADPMHEIICLRPASSAEGERETSGKCGNNFASHRDAIYNHNGNLCFERF